MVDLPADLLHRLFDAVDAVRAYAPAPPAPQPRLLGVQPPSINDVSGGGAPEFINLVWVSRGFRPPATPYAYSGGPALDPDGWPTGDFGIRLITNGRAGRAGVYLFRANLRNVTDPMPTLKANGGKVQNIVRDPTATLITAEISVTAVPGKLINLEVVAAGTNGGLTGVEVLAPGYSSAAPIFTDEYRKALEKFGAKRWMGAQRTNDSTVTSWSQVGNWKSPHWSNGVPPDVCLDWGAITSKPTWLCVPHAADDDYVRQLGNLIRFVNPAGWPVYIEYSNEVWNYIYKQAKYNLDQGAVEAAAGVDYGTTDLNKRRYARVARRSIQIKELLGDNPSVRMVLATQVNTGIPGEVLKAQLDYVEKFHGAPSKFFYGIATAPYFSCGNVTVPRADALANYELSDNLRKKLTAPDAPESIKLPMTSRINPPLTVDEICTRLLEKAPLDAATPGQVACNALAKKYGLRSLGYELGLDLQQYKTAVDVKIASQYDPRAGQAVEAYLSKWFEVGGEEGFYLQSHAPYGPNGYWGLTEDLTDLSTPKMQAAQRVAEKVGGGGEG